MLGRGKRAGIGFGVKALRGVDENNLTLLGLKEGQQRLGQQEWQADVCPVQGVQLLNRRIFKSSGSSRRRRSEPICRAS